LELKKFSDKKYKIEKIGEEIEMKTEENTGQTQCRIGGRRSTLV